MAKTYAQMTAGHTVWGLFSTAVGIFWLCAGDGWLFQVAAGVGLWCGGGMMMSGFIASLQSEGE